MRAHAILAASFVFTLAPESAAFPPYRSTDAGTADPWVLEPRLGLVKATRESGSDVEVAAPLGRLNLGLPQHFEIVGEAEYSPRDERLGDAAAGAKWAPLHGKLSFGTEVLALLPVSSEGGIGVEGQLLASYRASPLRLHLNGGAFADGRPDPSERGWRASVLGELDLDGARPGVELFAKRVADEPVQVLAGLGTIANIGSFDVRLGVHAGLTDASPELVGSAWLSTAIPLD